MNTSKAKQGTRAPCGVQNSPTDTGVTTRNPCLPPSYITASFGLVQEAAGAPRAAQLWLWQPQFRQEPW